MSERGITPMKKNYAEWYTDIVLKAELADYAPVRGCMVIRPYGFAIWEAVKAELDRRIKATGVGGKKHRNAYFPLLIPQSLLTKEEEHVEGFSPECAVVTHGGGKALEEPLNIRPTSETIMYKMYAKWIQSWRDLPLLINQWANIVRWELRTRLFLRTLEFLWQEGHTAHATHEEAQEEVLMILNDVYRDFVENVLAIPVVVGRKSEGQKFPGALTTYTLEAMMQDGRALQMGTSHDLGQNFAKAFDVRFQDENGDLQYVWQTSWGVSTRLIGALIMAHSDDKGLVLPPRIAPTRCVVVPIYKTDQREAVTAEARAIESELAGSAVARDAAHSEQAVVLDERDQYKPGWKFAEWELRGVPIRIEIGPKDVAAGKAVLVRRDTGERIDVPRPNLCGAVTEALSAMQEALRRRAEAFLRSRTHRADTLEELAEILDGEGGFVHAPWCGARDCEDAVQEKTRATVRCIPSDAEETDGLPCVACGGEAKWRVPFAKAY